jgi:hypothetical protein
MSYRKILLSVMENFGIPEPEDWTAKNWFKEGCLSLDSPSGQTTALFHAASLRWDELSTLLIEHGASPQSTCFLHSSDISSLRGRASTVLARLLGATENANNEVLNLLTTAASFKIDRIINLQDVSEIMRLHPAGKDLVKWKNGSLTWDRHTIGKRIALCNFGGALPLRILHRNRRLKIQTQNRLSSWKQLGVGIYGVSKLSWTLGSIQTAPVVN